MNSITPKLTPFQKAINRFMALIAKENAPEYEGIMLSREQSFIDDGQAYGALVDRRPDFVRRDNEAFLRGED